MTIRPNFLSSRDAIPLDDPVQNVRPWDIVRFRPPNKTNPDQPRNGGFMPGIVLGVCHKNEACPRMIVMPICFMPEMADYDPRTEQKINDTKQMRLMGLIRNDPRLVRAYVSMSIPNGHGFLSSESFASDNTLRQVPQTLANVITRKFEAVVNERAARRAHMASPVYGWGAEARI